MSNWQERSQDRLLVTGLVAVLSDSDKQVSVPGAAFSGRGSLMVVSLLLSWQGLCRRAALLGCPALSAPGAVPSPSPPPPGRAPGTEPPSLSTVPPPGESSGSKTVTSRKEEIVPISSRDKCR